MRKMLIQNDEEFVDPAGRKKTKKMLIPIEEWVG